MDIADDLREIKLASQRMVKHIDFVERHISRVETLITMFTPSLSRFFKKIDKEDIPFYDVV